MHFSAFERYSMSVLEPAGVRFDVVEEDQNSDYESGLAEIGEETWHVRTGRNTPTKPGAFVAFWKRQETGETAPFSDGETAQGLIVFVEQYGNRGLFRFTTEHLHELGIPRSTQNQGKRGFRVYPPWCSQLNRQAAATQRAQAPAFLQY